MEERRCPICKSDIYLNPDIILYISPCFHKLCESCMYRIFNKGQAPCPECGTMLRKINYMMPTFEDIQVERECKIRRILLRAFRRDEDEFDGGEEEYNRYLEEFENLVFESLELKNESTVREKMKSIQEMGDESILNPVTNNASEKIKAPHRRIIAEIESIDERSKVLKVGLSSDYFNPRDLPRIMIRSTKKIHLPSGYLKVYTPGGLIQDMIISLAISSLSNPEI